MSERARKPLLVALVVTALFAVPALVLILTGNLNGRAAYDAINYHERVVLDFATQLPSVDVSDYLSATTPGYHYALAWVAKTVDDSRTTLRLSGLVFTLVMTFALGFSVGRRAPPVVAVAVCLPFVASFYVLASGAHTLPDNAGWLGVLLVLLLAFRPRLCVGSLTWMGLALLALVLVRQIHVWTLGVIMTAAWLGTREDADQTNDLAGLFSEPGARIRRTVIALVFAVPAIAVLVYFVRLWGGLAPPSFQQGDTGVEGGNLATPAFVLAQIGLHSVFFCSFFVGPLLRTWRARPWLVGLGALGGLAVALVPETSYSVEAGRFSGFWDATRLVPSVADRSPVIWAGSMAGGVCLIGWCSAVSFRDRWILLGAVFAFVVAQTANFFAWQRYHEPFLLMLLAVLASRVREPEGGGGVPTVLRGPVRAWRVIGPIVLAIGLAALSAVAIVTARPATLNEPEELFQPRTGVSNLPERDSERPEALDSASRMADTSRRALPACSDTYPRGPLSL